MLEVNYIRANKDAIVERLEARNLSPEVIHSMLDNAITIDDDRKRIQTELDQLNNQTNTISKQIGELFKAGKREEAETLKAEVNAINEKSKVQNDALKAAKEKLIEQLLDIPNVPHSSVPKGNTDEDNEVYKAWEGALPELTGEALPHWELAEKYQMIDFKLGVKITGAGFPLYRGKGSKLQRALINFFLDEAEKAGYEEIIPPLLVNEDSARGTGQLPDKEGQMYHVTKDELYLVPTAEVPLTNIYRDVILKESDFPKKITGYTPCFRREAGSYGAHVKGLNRVHQFDKIEIVQVTHPDKSYEVLEEMMEHVAGILTKLELPFRILRLCGGDLGFASALTYDFETYSAAQKKWLEVSSVSNFVTFQTNRLKLRFKDANGKMQLAHTLNGSALALARIVASLMENHQTPDGIRIPEALRPYTGFDMIS